MKRKASKGNRWDDHYTRRARKEKYPARSVYKLEEIQQKHRILRKGDAVLDLGCAPGSWLLYAAKIVGASGKVVGVDLQPVTIGLPANASVQTADVQEIVAGSDERIRGPFDVVISDMAPATTGNVRVDAARSFYLCQAALDVADRVLKSGGRFVCKMFQGEDTQDFQTEVKNRYAKLAVARPKSTRKASREMFIIGIGKR